MTTEVITEEAQETVVAQEPTMSVEDEILALETQMENLAQENLNAGGAISKFSSLAHQYVRIANRLDTLEEKQVKEKQAQEMAQVTESIESFLKTQDLTKLLSYGDVRFNIAFKSEKYPEGNVSGTIIPRK